MITIKLQGFEKSRALLDPGAYKSAVNSSIKKIATQAKTEASSVIRETYSIKKKDLDHRIKLTPPRRDQNRAILTATGRPIALTYFGAKEYRNIAGQRAIIDRKGRRNVKRSKMKGGVTVAIRTGGRKTNLPNAFIATMKSGHIGVFIRDGQKVLPISEKKMVTIATLFGGKRTERAINKLVQAKFDALFKHELEFYLNRGKR